MNEIAVAPHAGHIQIGKAGEAPTLQDLVPFAEIIYRAQGERIKRSKEAILAAMLFGERFGMSPLEAVGAIHVIDGIPVLAAGAIASRVQTSGRFRYRQERLDPKGCTLRWEEKDPDTGKWEVVGTSSFTDAEAAKAGLLTKKAWEAYPEDLMFSRALTRGVRRFAPSLFSGAVYVAEEIESDRVPTIVSATGSATAEPAPAQSLADRVAAAAAATAVDAEFRETPQDAVANDAPQDTVANDAPQDTVTADDIRLFLRENRVKGSEAINVLSNLFGERIERISAIPEGRISEALAALQEYAATL